MRTRALALLITALLITGCSDGGTGTGAQGGQRNDADVTFAQEMIPHHAQAVEMAKLAKEHASDPRVKKLATTIEAAQGPEIKQMTGWLKAWGEDVPDSKAGGHNMSDGSMSGMMSDADMKALAQARGPGFDRMFLTMMIKHHEGAIAMAKTEQAEGKNSEAKALAKRIETSQTAEITNMKAILASMK